MTYTLHKNDIPGNLDTGKEIAIDTETMGLCPERDRLCLAQLSTGDGHAHLVQFCDRDYNAPNLKALLADQTITKIFHFARFDVAIFQKYLKVDCKSVYCTKIASKICRTFTDRHGLKSICQDLLDVEISKENQSSDWGKQELSNEQLKYAASDVLYLHAIKEKLDTMLAREGREHLAKNCFEFINTRAELDLLGWRDKDIFSHSA